MLGSPTRTATGSGFFPGLTSKLDYLAELGITCIWLLPFFPSTWRDNGYDITDYFSVDPRLGTLDDFLEFMHRADERGIRVILDAVANHTSNQHPWFQAARRDEASRYRDYYIWSHDPPPLPPEEETMFPGAENSVWTYDEVARSSYYHRFYDFEPGLNPNNEDVREEILRMLDLWLSFGAAGFRLDAATT